MGRIDRINCGNGSVGRSLVFGWWQKCYLAADFEPIPTSRVYKFGNTWRRWVFGDESPQIAKQVFTYRKSSICWKWKPIRGFGKNGHFVMKFGYLLNKTIIFGEKNSADRKLRYVHCRLQEKRFWQKKNCLLRTFAHWEELTKSQPYLSPSMQYFRFFLPTSIGSSR